MISYCILADEALYVPEFYFGRQLNMETMHG